MTGSTACAGNMGSAGRTHHFVGPCGSCPRFRWHGGGQLRGCTNAFGSPTFSANDDGVKKTSTISIVLCKALGCCGFCDWFAS